LLKQIKFEIALEPIGVTSHYFGEDLDSFTTYYLQE